MPSNADTPDLSPARFLPRLGGRGSPLGALGRLRGRESREPCPPAVCAVVGTEHRPAVDKFTTALERALGGTGVTCGMAKEGFLQVAALSPI